MEPWVRSVLNHSTQEAVAASTWSTSRQGPSWWISSDLYRPICDSARELSYASPTGPDGRVDAFVDEPVGERDRRVDTGLNRWKQHLIGGCCGTTVRLDERSDGAGADAFARPSRSSACKGT